MLMSEFLCNAVQGMTLSFFAVSLSLALWFVLAVSSRMTSRIPNNAILSQLDIMSHSLTDVELFVSSLQTLSCDYHMFSDA